MVTENSQQEMDEISKLTKQNEKLLRDLDKRKKNTDRHKQNLLRLRLQNQKTTEMTRVFSELATGISATEILSDYILTSGRGRSLIQRVSYWFSKNSQAILTFLATITVAAVGFLISWNQLSQKTVELSLKDTELKLLEKRADGERIQQEREIELAKIKELGILVPKLASSNVSERRYAAFAAVSLRVGGFASLIMSSFSNDPSDIATLEMIREQGKDDESLKKDFKRISKYLAEKAEELKDTNEGQSLEYADKAFSFHSINSLARYRRAKVLYSQGKPAWAIITLVAALSDVNNSDDATPSASLAISINERLGQLYDENGNRENAVEFFAKARDLLSTWREKDAKDYERLKIIEGCVQSKETCKLPKW